MGPASENAGYGSPVTYVRLIRFTCSLRATQLQWVRRQITPVMIARPWYKPAALTKSCIHSGFNGSSVRVTPVMRTVTHDVHVRGSRRIVIGLLQWVQVVRATPVMDAPRGFHMVLWGQMASMGPASENAGYSRNILGSELYLLERNRGSLQWVQRPRTPVICHSRP